MNNDLISREALKKALNEMFDTVEVMLFDDIIATIDNAPTVKSYTLEDLEKAKNNGYKWGRIDGRATARPQGEWKDESRDSLLCTCCNKRIYKPFIGGFPTERSQHYYPNFCAFCGANMQKGGAE